MGILIYCTIGNGDMYLRGNFNSHCPKEKCAFPMTAGAGARHSAAPVIKYDRQHDDRG
jgi:hypothetical protein